MAAEFEVYSFVNKFMNLSRNGEKADLSLNCEHGRIVVNLKLHLHEGPPAPFHPYPPPRPQQRPYHHPSPSRLRRSERRRRAQVDQAVTKHDKTEQVSSIKNDANDKAEEVFKVDSQDILVTAEKAGSITEVNPVQTQLHPLNSNTSEAMSRPTETLQKSDDDYCVPAVQAVPVPPPPQPPHPHEQEQFFTSNQQFILICNFCNKEFETEEVLKDHTSIEHKSGRIRFQRKIKEFPNGMQ